MLQWCQRNVWQSSFGVVAEQVISASKTRPSHGQETDSLIVCVQGLDNIDQYIMIRLTQASTPGANCGSQSSCSHDHPSPLPAAQSKVN